MLFPNDSRQSPAQTTFGPAKLHSSTRETLGARGKSFDRAARRIGVRLMCERFDALDGGRGALALSLNDGPTCFSNFPACARDPRRG